MERIFEYTIYVVDMGILKRAYETDDLGLAYELCNNLLEDGYDAWVDIVDLD